MNTFLPKNYELPISTGGYMKLQDGDNLFRVLSDAITGYEYWTEDKKPIRSVGYPKSTPNIKTEKDGSKKVKHFWAFVVWNYKTENVEILQITQSTIQSAMTNLVQDEDWGDPREYDLKINRKGEGFETVYTVSPKPKKSVPEEIAKAFKEKPITLDALYKGESPFEKKI